jgi:hypothetical protein
MVEGDTKVSTKVSTKVPDVKVSECENPSEMFFPDDLRGLLREFTRPCFKYIQEYNAYKRTHKNSELLRAKLEEDSLPVVECLRDYLASAEQKAAVDTKYCTHMAQIRPEFTVAELIQFRVDQEWLREESEYASWLTCWYHHELQRELIGRSTLIEEWMPYERTPLYEEDDDDYSLRRWEWTAGGWVATQVGWT